MSAVSVGWFDPAVFADDVPRMVRKIVARITSGAQLSGRGTNPALPFLTRQIGPKKTIGYVAIARPLAMAIDPTDRTGGSFHFVLHANGRPALVTASVAYAREAMAGEAKKGTPIGMGGIELELGLAVHFEPSTCYTGMIPLPVAGDLTGALHHASVVMIRADGFAADQIGEAVEAAREAVQADRAYWDRPDGFIMNGDSQLQ